MLQKHSKPQVSFRVKFDFANHQFVSVRQVLSMKKIGQALPTTPNSKP